LGNTFIIYPSLDSASYKTIINNQITEYCASIKETYDKIIVFDEKVHNMVFKEGVFPTLGVRSVTSSINEIIKATTSKALLYGIENHLNYNTIKFTYNNKKLVSTFYNENIQIANQLFPVKMRLEVLRVNKKSENQCNTAVHESGHAVANMVLFNSVPVSVFSITADRNSDGFTLNSSDSDDHVESKEHCERQVQVSLAGMAAERLVFGDDYVSTGCNSDLATANSLLFSLYRELGLKGRLVRSCITPLSNTVKRELDSKIADSVERDLQHLMDKVICILNSERDLFLAISKYLSQHTFINKKQLVKMAREYGSEKLKQATLDGKVNGGYIDKLNSMN
jgi:cell division protease FtsH